MERKGKKLIKKLNKNDDDHHHHHQLVEYHSLPAYLKDNEFILRYYRSEWPLKQALLSIFCIHNETLNIWTHLIGFFIFLNLTIYTTTKVPISSVIDLHKIQAELLNCLPSFPNMTDDFHRLKDELRASELLSSLSTWPISDLLTKCLPKRLSPLTNQTEKSVLHITKDALMIQNTIPRWPFFAFLGGAMSCLLASTACHLLTCHSKRLRYVMLRFDYSSISALITTSFYPSVYYSFMCHPVFCHLYLGFITAIGLGTMVFSLIPAFQKPHFRPYRTSLFFAMGMSGVVPVVHKLELYGDHPEALETTAYEVLMGVLYGIGACIYVMRVPERWRPGRFDIVCSSHQIFHVLVVAGAYTHYHTGLIYLRWRDAKGC